MAPPVASVVRRTFKSRPKALSGSAPSGLSVLRSYPFALASMSTYPEGSGVVAVIARSACRSRLSYCETDLSLPPATTNM
jgi:hypothetical protein